MNLVYDYSRIPENAPQHHQSPDVPLIEVQLADLFPSEDKRPAQFDVVE